VMDKTKRFYVGYEIAIRQPDGSWIKVDVTGAASRFADKAKITGDDHASAGKMKRADDDDASPEGGGFAGGYAASATQTARYRAGKEDSDADEAGTQEP